jgi:WD40 repeat protein
MAIAIYDDQGDSGATAQVWDVRSGRALTNFDGDHLWVNQVVFNPSGTRIVTAGSTPPFLTKIWDTASGGDLLTLSGHTSGVLTAAFSPDGNGLATGGYDSTVKLWDPMNGRELFTLLAPKHAVWSVAFSPNGKRLASAGSDQVVRLYAINPVDLVALAASHLTRAFTADECRRYLRRDDCSKTPSSRVVAGNELFRNGHDEAAIAIFRQVFGSGTVRDSVT